MSVASRAFAIVLTVSVCAGFAADDPPAPKAVAAAAENAAPKEQDFKGELGGKGLAAKPGVVAIMKVPKADKADAVEWVDLYAEGELATKLEDLGDKHAELTITGVRTADGIKVSKAGDDVKIPTPKKGKKK